MTHCTSKIMRDKLTQYCHADKYALEQCYTRCSAEKHRAFAYCMRLAERFKAGTNYAILSYNTFSFTFGFVGTDPDNGRHIFAYITPTHDRFIYLDEIVGNH